MIPISVPPIAGYMAQGLNNPVDTLNVRDALSGIIGKGFTDLKSEDARNAYAFLRTQLGYNMASKLMTHALMFNQRTDMLKKSPEEKISSFYDIGSNDPELNAVIGRAGRISQGPIAGVRSSPDVLNYEISNRKQFDKDQMMLADKRPLAGAAAKLQ